ncbi:pentapeptide repeat-containing protein [Pseudomonas sp. NPDC089422]|uniref:pentapeptide repeat-containing protein n=1 Tax=Pseudomonas sp. NPDC089422 TaxID=3364466 RepID=UPI0038231046
MKNTSIIALLATIIVIAITGFWPSVSSTVLPNTTWGLYSKDFFENVLVEAHGTLIDLIVVGLVLYWFEQRNTKKEEITKNLELLKDLRFYQSEGAPYKTFGTIRRLLSLNETSLNLSESNLSKLTITSFNFTKCRLHATLLIDTTLKNVEFSNCLCDGIILAGATLQNTTFAQCSLRRAKFNNAKLNGIDFTTCEIQDANFTNSTLRSSNFKNIDCLGVNFSNADLRSANLIGVRNIDLQSLENAKSLRGVKTDNSDIKRLIASRVWP